MQWSEEDGCGFTEGMPWIEAAGNYREINVRLQTAEKDSVYHFYKKLISLRKEKTVISKGSIEFFMEENPDVLAYRRTYRQEELVVLNNLTGKEVILLAEAAWCGYEKILGNYEENHVTGDGVVLKAFETLVLEKRG